MLIKKAGVVSILAIALYANLTLLLFYLTTPLDCG